MSPVPTPLPEDPLMTPESALLSASSWFSCCSRSARLFSTAESLVFFCLRIAKEAAFCAAQAAQKAACFAMRKQKNTRLSAVENDLALLEQQENQLLAESNALSGVINGSSGSGVGTGDMIWPVNGPITSPFGYRIHPILGYRKLHTGIDFGVGYGTPIQAADSGTVIYATWMSGYGNVIIIDHGRGISTLYAHQSSLAVGNGARVSRAVAHRQRRLVGV